MSRIAKVGAFFLVALIAAGWFVLRIQHIRIGRYTGIQYKVDLPDADGLQEKSWVLFKGVRVGKIRKLELVGDGVIVSVDMEKRIPLREGARAQVSSVGLLGEKQLELLQGDEAGALLGDGARMPGSPSASLDRVLGMASKVGEDVKDVTGSLRDAELVETVSALAKELRELVAANRSEVTDSMRSVESAAASVDVASRNASALSESLARTAAVLESIALRLERGEGAAGKLLFDEETEQRLDETLSAVSDSAHLVGGMANGASSIDVGVSLRADYLAAIQRAKGFLTVQISSGEAWSLRLGAVSVPGLAATPLFGDRAEDRMEWSAELGYRWQALGLRMGIMESRLGLGGDAYLFRDRLRLSADVWDLSRSELNPHARLEFAVYPVQSFFFVGGWDDVLNVGDSDSAFFGAGLRFGP